MILKLMINAMPEKEQIEFNKLMGGAKETTEVSTWTGDDFPKSPKGGKSSRRSSSAMRAKRIAELPVVDRNISKVSYY